MKLFRNFLALWAGILLTVFVVAELIQAGKAVIAYASTAFAFTTAWWVVVVAMVISIVAAIIISVSHKRKE